MDDTLVKRLQSLSPEKRKTLELYLKSKGIDDAGILTSAKPGEERGPGDDAAISQLKGRKYGKYVRRELQIKPSRNITSFLGRAFTLSILLADEGMYPWYYQHFVQVCSQTDDTGYTVVDFMEPPFPEEFIGETAMGYAELKDTPNIVEYVAGKIDEGYYAVVCLDEYYLNDKAAFMKLHFVHESMIYGYDNDAGKFLAVSYNEYRIFDKITFDYDMFAKAFEEGELHYKKFAPYAERRAVLLWLPKVPLEEQARNQAFDMTGFLKDLDSYLHSAGDENKIFIYATENHARATRFGAEIRYGVDVYDVMVNKIEDMFHDKVTIDFRALHLLTEHKKVMYERLQYILSHFNISDVLAQKCREYAAVVKQFDDVRRKSLEQRYSKIGYEKWDQSLAEEVIEFIKAVKEEEKAILTGIFEGLKREFQESYISI